MSQSVPNIYRDSGENIVLYYSQNIRLKIIHYTCCLNFSLVGKRLKKSMQQVLALRQSRYFFRISAITLKIRQKHRDSISHIARTVNVLGEDPTKITITNANIDKQITLKRDYIYNIEKTDLKIGVSGVLSHILFYSENSLMTYSACFQQKAKKTKQRCSLLHHQYITQNDVYHKINDVTNVPVYSRLKQDNINLLLQAVLGLLL